MSTLLQTLYWNANPSSTVTDISGSGVASQSRAITAAESHDASDATYARLNAGGDSGSLEGEATNDLDAALQTASAVGVIDFVRIKMRGKVSSVGGGTASGTLQPRINGTLRGSPQTLSGAFANMPDQDFATDPADGLAWTNAKLNAQSFGLQEYVITSDPGVFGTQGRADASEFSVEVWGTATQTSTPASVGMAAAVGAAVVAVVASCVSVNAPVVANNAVGAPTGSVVSTPDSVESRCIPGAYVDLLAPVSRRDPSEVVPHAAFADTVTSPVTLRSNTSPLGDENLSTFASQSTPGTSWPVNTTLTVNAGGFAVSAIEGSGTISGVKLFAFARVKADAHAVVSNARFRTSNGGDHALTSAPPVGSYASPPNMALVQTGLLTTYDGTNPWTWADVHPQLVGTMFKVDVSIGGAYIGEFAQLEVAEIWAEVHGPLGTEPIVVFKKGPVGRLPIIGNVGKLTRTGRIRRIIIP